MSHPPPGSGAGLSCARVVLRVTSLPCCASRAALLPPWALPELDRRPCPEGHLKTHSGHLAVSEEPAWTHVGIEGRDSHCPLQGPEGSVARGAGPGWGCAGQWPCPWMAMAPVCVLWAHLQGPPTVSAEGPGTARNGAPGQAPGTVKGKRRRGRGLGAAAMRGARPALPPHAVRVPFYTCGSVLTRLQWLERPCPLPPSTPIALLSAPATG